MQDEVYTYTVKLKVKDEVWEAFAHFMYHEHLPEVVSTGLFSKPQLEINMKDSSEMIARAICSGPEAFDEYIEKHADKIRGKVALLFPDAILSIERILCKVY